MAAVLSAAVAAAAVSFVMMLSVVVLSVMSAFNIGIIYYASVNILLYCFVGISADSAEKCNTCICKGYFGTSADAAAYKYIYAFIA